jgi:hypothetical protein
VLNGGGWVVFIAPTTIHVVAVDGHTGQSGGAPDKVLFAVRCLPHQQIVGGLERLIIEVLCPLVAPDSPVAH